MSGFDAARLARPEILALEPYASARSLADDSGILLNANENPFPPAIDGGRGLNRYPEPQPSKLVARFAELYGVGADRLLVTRGSDEGIDLLVRTFCRPGHDAVLVCPPCFGMYALSARVQGAPVLVAPLVERNGEFGLHDATAERAAGCRIVFLCSPNNPTGNRVRADEIREIAAAAGDGLVVVDEAYAEFDEAPSAIGLLDEVPNLVVLRTLSKAWALAGCRVGCVVAAPSVIALLRRILAPYPLPTPTIERALAALSPDARAAQARALERIAAEKPRLVEALARHPAIERVWPGHANFVLVRAADGPGLVSAAAAAGIRLRDQSRQPGLADCVRVTIGTREENDRLIEFLEEEFPATETTSGGKS
ncbi:MAG: histidinol-phosphate transaminase [Wenzhouxiangellaceae bacterium]|nr:histidinol-phosphate transaminase [Wenzhouxiangellaceae bacterium]